MEQNTTPLPKEGEEENRRDRIRDGGGEKG